MHRSPWTFFALFLGAATVGAEEVSGSIESAQNNTATISTFSVRAYPDHLSDLKIAEKDFKVHASGLVVDYYPFDTSGFRVSAGAYGHDKKRGD